jgi:hypothetical protein
MEHTLRHIRNVIITNFIGLTLTGGVSFGAFEEAIYEILRSVMHMRFLVIFTQDSKS